jgi:hypothetical protein
MQRNIYTFTEKYNCYQMHGGFFCHYLYSDIPYNTFSIQHFPCNVSERKLNVKFSQGIRNSCLHFAQRNIKENMYGAKINQIIVENLEIPRIQNINQIPHRGRTKRITDSLFHHEVQDNNFRLKCMILNFLYCRWK